MQFINHLKRPFQFHQKHRDFSLSQGDKENTSLKKTNAEYPNPIQKKKSDTTQTQQKPSIQQSQNGTKHRRKFSVRELQQHATSRLIYIGAGP